MSHADAEQRVASDPSVSAFVSASAGSGKTKLLTDRLLRLMLKGADPARILCLTFTKAAAAEMAIRLQARLGRWVIAADETLDADLRGFGLIPNGGLCTRARALFADVLDLPGGMRIGTIHAFCQSLLRRFPLEANLSPHFRLIEANDADAARRDAREAMLAEAHGEERRAALTTLAGLVSLEGFSKLVAKLESERARFGRAAALPPGGLLEALDSVTGADRSATVADMVQWTDDRELRQTAMLMREKGSSGAAGHGQKLLDWLGLDAEDRVDNWSEWRDVFIGASGPRKFGNHVNPKLASAHPELKETLEREQERILAFEDLGRAAVVSDLSAALIRLADPVISGYAARKEQAEQLDFGDLIARCNALLEAPGAEWVLYKLDGGLDHLLLDEVQDTAPEQWSIAAALTDDFFTGAGAREPLSEGARTIFAVGDRKQSIYSFQGADPDAFELWRRRFAERARAADAAWKDVQLHVSFRSTAPVLELVDAVFAQADASSGVTLDEPLFHKAHRGGHAGLIELWPLTPRPEHAPPEPWQVPDRNLGGISAPQRLADSLAEWIARQTDGSVMLESRGRPLSPGDVLILVRRRGEFARSLVGALKQRGVPVAGIDRMVLTDQPAVADLLALCDALLHPGDDLQFACMLTSPLGGLTDNSLMRLAMGREDSLWAALNRRAGEREDWRAAADFFAALLARVDYVSPYALLNEALGPLGARARLLARLGPEAAEPIDELLGAALAYAASHPQSLQGFVHSLRQSGAEVKREAESAGHLVRVMTVHGAKGLQAPLVILPDTTAMSPDEGSLIWGLDEATGVEVPVWSPQADLRCRAVDRLRAAAAARQGEEMNRLLYVALTRAEDRLLVCGWEPRSAVPDRCWYELVRRGFATMSDVESSDFDAVSRPWPGQMSARSCPQIAIPAAPDQARERDVAAALPAWAGLAPDWRPGPLPAEPALPSPLAPSRPQGIKLGAVPSAASPLASRDAAGDKFRRGRLVHALLQHLPSIARAERVDAARRYVARPGSGVPGDGVADLVDEVLAVLDHPELAPLFGPGGRAEVPLTGVVAGQVIGGLVDRLVVDGARVIVADYKTNRSPPAAVEKVPVIYLRQMSAYRAVLRAVFPAHEVRSALVWTVGCVVMPLPDALLDRHAPATA